MNKLRIPQSIEEIAAAAEIAAKQQMQENALFVVALSVAGGAIGGFLLRGTTGKLIIAGAGAYALSKLMQGDKLG